MTNREGNEMWTYEMELRLMGAPDEAYPGERCEDAPCCGCCDPGSAVMP